MAMQTEGDQGVAPTVITSIKIGVHNKPKLNPSNSVYPATSAKNSTVSPTSTMVPSMSPVMQPIFFL